MPFSSLMSVLAQVAPAVAEAPWYQQGWFNFLIAMAVLVLPFVFGHWWAKKLRMNDYGWRIGIVAFALVAGIVVCVRGWPPKLGIDLSGGVILVYEVDQSKTSAVDLEGVAQQIRKELANEPAINATVSITSGKLEIVLPTAEAAETAKAEARLASAKMNDVSLVLDSHTSGEGKQTLVYNVRQTGSIDMDKMISAISKRVNPGGQLEVTIRRMGADRVEVIIPRADPQEIDVIKDKISTAGALQFRILATPQKDARIIELAKKVDGRDVVEEIPDGKRELVAQWVALDPEKFNHPDMYQGMVTRPGKNGSIEALVVVTPFDVSGGYLSRAVPSFDPESGGPSVAFSFNARGALLFGELTGNHLPDPSSGFHYLLGIILDDKLMSAPRLNSRITNTGQIVGNFTEQEVNFLVDILNAGSLPAALSKVPVAEYNASAQLGNDTIRAGAYSMIFATVAILIFMQIYYRFAGFIANIAVLLNLLLVMALMILIKAHLTLAGLAGLVLSVGMAVDANVLIYERIREEEERGAALRMAIRNGFGRAMATIIDSHCTTLITGIVLYVIGTDQLRGFATTLVLGLLLNLFTAVYCSRIIFDIAERRGQIKYLKMMKIFGKTNFDFVKWMPVAMAASVVLIVIGLGAAVAREAGWFGGAGLFGIDFTGGTAVQVVFNKPTDIAVVRTTVRKAVVELPDVSVSAVQSGPGEEPNTRFNIDTSFQAKKQAGETANSETIKAVKKELTKLFEGQLKTYAVEATSITAIGTDAPAAKDTEGKAAKDGEKKSDATAEATENKTTPAVAAISGESVAKLRFPDGITGAALDATLKQALTDAQLPEAVIDLSTDDPEYTPGGGHPVKDWTVKISLPKEQTEKLVGVVQQDLAATPVFPTANSIGGKVAGDTKITAFYALGVSTLLVALYIWIRFQNLIFGMAAIVALVHDVALSVGALAISFWLANFFGFLLIDPFKISLEVVASLLTIVGYSINDTIVVFDRIREIRGKSADLTPTMINQAVNQTLSRTILTSSTVLLVTLILYIFGGEGVHAFAYAMLIGVLTGTYSSVFIAAPILLWFRRPAPSGPVRSQTAGVLGSSRAATA
jgi:SecD/SecF fusion protein